MNVIDFNSAIMESFLKAYVEKFKFQSITTDDWKTFFLSYFSTEVGILFVCTLYLEVFFSDRQAVVYLIMLNGTNGYMAMGCLQSHHGKDEHL